MVKVVFRRTVVIEQNFPNMTVKEVRKMIQEFGAHEIALDGNPVTDDTKVVSVKEVPS